MLRRSIGAVEFRDLHFNTRAQIVITRMPESNMTGLFLDLDVDGPGVLGAGDCEIGLDRGNTRRLLTLVQQAISVHLTRNRLWHPVGKAEFSWSDHSRSGEDNGTVLVESNGATARMVIQTSTGAWAPYVATFSSTILDELSVLLSRTLHES
jgi:hypothetical protein